MAGERPEALHFPTLFFGFVWLLIHLASQPNLWLIRQPFPSGEKAGLLLPTAGSCSPNTHDCAIPSLLGTRSGQEEVLLRAKTDH